jgi:hypothetical protein
MERLITLYVKNEDQDYRDIILLKIWELVNKKNYLLTVSQRDIIENPLSIFDKSTKKDLFKSDWNNNKYKDLIFKKI